MKQIRALSVVLALFSASCIWAQDRAPSLIERIIVRNGEQGIKPGQVYEFVGWLNVEGEFRLSEHKDKFGYGQCISGLYGKAGLYDNFKSVSGRKVKIVGVLSRYHDGIIEDKNKLLSGKDFSYFENSCASDYVVIATSVELEP